MSEPVLAAPEPPKRSPIQVLYWPNVVNFSVGIGTGVSNKAWPLAQELTNLERVLARA